MPACFTHSQRNALIKAVDNAGIALLGLINDPAAAALHVAYAAGLESGLYLVIPSGFFSFEASVIDLQDKLIETKAIKSDRLLSSHSITKALVEKLQPRFPDADAPTLILLADRAKRAHAKGQHVH